MLNNANYDLPQHIYSGIPFYQARTATEAMKRKLGPFMTTANINGKLLRNLIEKWQVRDGAGVHVQHGRCTVAVTMCIADCSSCVTDPLRNFK